ncbi:MAG: OmpH family outer membrane protein [Muribaculaceae bacterium]|nr:OmpH family outer membrane protein [Muribaculaceae bacterium]
MFKKLILALAVVLPLSAFAQKFGTVKAEEVLEAMPEYTALTTQISEASKKYEAEYTKLNDEVNKLYADFQTIQNDPSTPDTIKERRMQEIQERSQKIQQFLETAQQDLARQREQGLAPITTKFNDAVKAVGQEGGYTMILPYDPGFILYQGADVVDITPAVRTKLGL